VYTEYAKSNSLVAVSIYAAALLCAQTASMGSSVWLKEWSEANQEKGYNADIGKFIGIYFAFGIGAAGLTVIQTLVLWIFCSIEVGA